jgi:2-C-methyl-D-erythritol 4-phosphate cytidylyltransferase
MNTAPVAVIICAAGTSSRMGGKKKEYQKLDNSESITVLGASVNVFCAIPSVETIVITVPENGETDAHAALPPLLSLKPEFTFVTGGKTRQVSVFNALSCLVAHKPQYVLIHDGARPWISLSLVNDILEAVKEHDAVIPLLPLTETPKELEPKTLFIKTHLKRTNTGVAQTPQCFKFPEILHAHIKAMETHDEEFTDDAEIWSRFCGKVAIVPGDPKNKKITFQEDLY